MMFTIPNGFTFPEVFTFLEMQVITANGLRIHQQMNKETATCITPKF